MDKLIADSLALGATDLHLGQEGPVWARILGKLEVLEKVRGEDLAPILAQTGPGEKPGSSWSHTLADGTRVRIHLHSSLGGLRYALRLLPGRVPALESLGLPLSPLRLDRVVSGLVLISGATGSGKTTTLASLVQKILETRPCHVLTFEDPVEYLLAPGRGLVTQGELGVDFADYPQALRSAVRSDPDVIVVGEMRDYETARAALSLADTGHLVFSTIHASSAADALLRLLDLFPEGDRGGGGGLLAATLQGVVYQELVSHAQGSSLVALAEILLGSPGLARLIREGDFHQIPNLIRSGRGEGMVDFDTSLGRALGEGSLTFAQAVDLAHYPEEFRQRLSRP